MAPSACRVGTWFLPLASWWDDLDRKKKERKEEQLAARKLSELARRNHNNSGPLFLLLLLLPSTGSSPSEEAVASRDFAQLVLIFFCLLAPYPHYPSPPGTPDDFRLTLIIFGSNRYLRCDDFASSSSSSAVGSTHHLAAAPALE